MNLVKLFLLSSLVLAFVACDSDSSSNSDNNSSSSSSKEYDCTMTAEGVKVLAPEGGETFSIGDTITVVFGANYANAGGFHVYYKADVDSNRVDLFAGSVGPEGPDGSECYEVTAILSADMGVIASDNAFIRVEAYNWGVIRGDSKTFTVKE